MIMSKKSYPSFLNKTFAISALSQKYMYDNNLYKDQIVLDIGCGKGQMMRCAIQGGAAGVCGIDISKDAVIHCKEEFKNNPNTYVGLIDVNDVHNVLNFVRKSMGEKPATLIICNAAQIPCPEPLPNGYFVGKDGRDMIEGVMKFAKEGLKTKPSVLYIGHSMLSNPMKTLQQCKELGLYGEIVEGTEIEFEVYEALRENEELLKYWKDEFGFNGIMHGCIVKITKEDGEEQKVQRNMKKYNFFS